MNDVQNHGLVSLLGMPSAATFPDGDTGDASQGVGRPYFSGLVPKHRSGETGALGIARCNMCTALLEKSTCVQYMCRHDISLLIY